MYACDAYKSASLTATFSTCIRPAWWLLSLVTTGTDVPEHLKVVFIVFKFISSSPFEFGAIIVFTYK